MNIKFILKESEEIKYFNDLPEEEKIPYREKRIKEIEAIGKLPFPIEATWGKHEEKVLLLGPTHNFPPYNKDPKKDNTQIIAIFDKGTSDERRSIIMATSIKVNGKDLITPWPLPIRRRDIFGNFF